MKIVSLLMLIICLISCNTNKKNLIAVNKTGKDICVVISNNSEGKNLINFVFINNEHTTDFIVASENLDKWKENIYNPVNNDSTLFIHIYEANIMEHKTFPEIRKSYKYKINQLDSLNWHIIIDKLDSLKKPEDIKNMIIPSLNK